MRLSLAALLIANVCLADPPAPPPSPSPAPAALQIVGETNLARDRMFRLRAVGAPADAALIWDVYPEESADIDDSDPRLLRFTGPPGAYKVKLRAITGHDVQTARLSVTIGSAAPSPTPIPGPGPSPQPPAPPAPAVSNVWLIVVDDMANRTISTGRVLGDLDFWKSIEGLGLHWHVFDQGEAEVSAKGYGAVAEKVGLPALLILGPDGSNLRSVKLPDTTGEIRTLVKEVTGR